MGYYIGYLLGRNSNENGNSLVMLITLLFSYQSLSCSNTQKYFKQVIKVVSKTLKEKNEILERVKKNIQFTFNITLILII